MEPLSYEKPVNKCSLQFVQKPDMFYISVVSNANLFGILPHAYKSSMTRVSCIFLHVQQPILLD